MKKKFGKTKWIHTRYAKPYKDQIAGVNLYRSALIFNTLCRNEARLRHINAASFRDAPTGTSAAVFELQKASAKSEVVVNSFKSVVGAMKATQPMVARLKKQYGITQK